jgi:hypothetical protein
MKNRTGQNRWKTDVVTEQLVRELARLLPDHTASPPFSTGSEYARPKDKLGPNCACAISVARIKYQSIERANVQSAMSLF